jgi:hypothetical protein
MFSVTFLGHQGWFVESDHTAILIDPLLTNAFGHGGLVGEIYPPRDIVRRALPPLAALLLTHEHDDHFDIPTLDSIDRRVPVLLSRRSSTAARTILAEMGFSVRLVDAGDRVAIGSLELQLFAPDHVKTNNSDEWDVLAFLVRDSAGDGSLFSHVDVVITDEMLAAVTADGRTPGLFCLTNNVVDWSFLTAGPLARSQQSPIWSVASEMLRIRGNLAAGGHRPAGTLFCGSGFAFPPDRVFLNDKVFCAETEAIVGAMRALAPDELFVAPLPGQTIDMEKGQVTSIDRGCPFMVVRDRQSWRDRTYRGRDNQYVLDDYPSASGRPTLDGEELDQLQDLLDEYGRYLYGKRVFKWVTSLRERCYAGRRPTFAIAVLVDSERSAVTFEYDPQGCRFVPSDCEDPAAEYAGGIECWGSDLLEVLQGKLGPSSLMFGRSRAWTCDPARLPMSPHDLWPFFNPLLSPDRMLRLYRRLWQQASGRMAA